MPTKPSWLDTVASAYVSSSWMGVWPPTQWLFGDRPYAAIPEPLGEECTFTREHERPATDDGPARRGPDHGDDERGAP